jgi:hypothetical protein
MRPMTESNDRDRTTPKTWILAAVAVVAVIVIALIVWALVGDDDDGLGDDVIVDGISNENAFDDDGFAESLVGQSVTVTAEVSEVLTPAAFRIGGDGFGEDGLLVLSPAAGTLSEGQEVVVIGIVRQFERDQLEGDLGWDLGGFDFTTWSDENVLAARQVTPQ